jgi:hypothetical protein
VSAIVSRLGRRRPSEARGRTPAGGATISTSGAAAAVPSAVAHTLAAAAGDLPASSASESSLELDRVTALFEESTPVLSPTGPLAIDVQRLAGAAVIMVDLPAGLGPLLVDVVRRLLPVLRGRRAAADVPAVDQVIVRGPEAAVVVTPLGPVGLGGPILATGTRRASTLALLTLLSRRAARAPRGAAVTPNGSEAGEAGPDLGSRVLRHEIEDVDVHLMFAPGLPGPGLGQVAAEAYQAVRGDSVEEALGPIEQLDVLLGHYRLVARPVNPAAHPLRLVVSGGPVDHRPGHAHLEVARAAARLRLAAPMTAGGGAVRLSGDWRLG